MSTFHINQRVVCIKALGKGGYGDEKPPVEGKVYTVRDIYFSDGSQCECLRLVEIVNAPNKYADIGYGECGFRSEYFSPLCENRIQIFTDMLNPVQGVPA